MATGTIYIAERDGTIAKVTDVLNRAGNLDIYHLTVEVPEEKTAYGMQLHGGQNGDGGGRPAIGSRVRFKGETVIERGPGGVEKKKIYYHNPTDGSPVQEWVYYELDTDLRRDDRVRRIGSEEFMRLIGMTIDGVAALNYNYQANWNDSEHLEYLIELLEKLTQEAKDKLARLREKDIISGI